MWLKKKISVKQKATEASVSELSTEWKTLADATPNNEWKGYANRINEEELLRKLGVGKRAGFIDAMFGT